MTIHQLTCGPIDTNAYLLQQRGETVLIDAPPACLPQVQQLLKGATLGALWLTHGHWDHIWAAAACERQWGINCWLHADDLPLLNGQADWCAGLMGEQLQPPSSIQPLRHHQVLKLAELEFRVLHTPGHSPGGVAFYCRSEQLLLSGDTLFQASVGATHFPGGDFQLLQQSVQTQLYTLPAETLVYPGHGKPTSIGAERKDNPYIRPR